MSSEESVHNDTAEPVEVSYQIKDAVQFGRVSEHDDSRKFLLPGETWTRPLARSLWRHVCVRYWVPHSGAQKRVCQTKWYAGAQSQDITYQVSDIVGPGILAFHDPAAQSK